MTDLPTSLDLTAVFAPPTARLLLQCAPADGLLIAEQSSVGLPQTMLQTAKTGAWTALHASPDDWMLMGPQDERAAMVDRFSTIDVDHSLVDVSDRNFGLEVSGRRAPDLLSSGCPVDLDPERFPTGACTGTLFGKVSILLWRRDDAPTFRLEFRRSFAGYIRDFVTQVAAEALT